MYTYANGNPVSYTDPTGTVFDIVIDVISIVNDLFHFATEGFTDTNVAAFAGDVVGAATPGLTGVGATIRAADKVKDVAKSTSELTKSQTKAIKSLEKQIQKHQQKLDDFKANPTVRPGMEDLPKEIIKQQQEERIRHLETEINTFNKNIEKIKNGEL
ncbi:hypothetical protein HC024_00505 [Methylococcaceae bacterium WWC4]|nr:hypothetical protein [Methylococcaceae bacterium WWC4]